MLNIVRWLAPVLLCAGLLYTLTATPEGPAQAAAEQFGVAMVSADSAVVGNALSKLGTSWWYTYGSTPTNPPGSNKVHLIRTPFGVPPLSLGELQTIAATGSPGAHWMIGNEPNVAGQDDVGPRPYAELLRYYATTIKQIDPRAKLVAPNILNWSDTCLNCGGFPRGQYWVDELMREYQQLYGAPPPVDVWGIHAYIIDWGTLPMVNWQLAVKQLDGLRGYLDSCPSEVGKPIWLTEFGVIWGYPGFQGAPNGSCPKESGCIAPTGEYPQSQISDYLRGILSWLQTNAGPKRIEKWFLFAHHGAQEPYATLPAGISVMDGPGASANLSASGQVFREFVQGTGAGPGTLTQTPAATCGVPPPSGGGSGGGSGGSSSPTPTPPAPVGRTPPALTGPAAGTLLPGLSTTLSWSNPPGTVQYQVQVVPFNGDGSGIDLVRNAETSYTVEAPNLGGPEPNYVMLPDLGYVWRVRTTNVARPPQQLAESDWSAWSAGAFRTPSRSSAGITLAGPAGGQTVSTTTPTLAWTNVDRDVFYYEVQLSRDPEFGARAFLYWELRHGGVTDPPNSYTVPARYPLEPETTYYWRVRPRIQGDGSPVPWSALASFRSGR